MEVHCRSTHTHSLKHTHTSSDADIFVMAETFTNDSARVIPGRAQYHWKSSRVGDDVVEVRVVLFVCPCIHMYIDGHMMGSPVRSRYTATTTTADPALGPALLLRLLLHHHRGGVEQHELHAYVMGYGRAHPFCSQHLLIHTKPTHTYTHAPTHMPQQSPPPWRRWLWCP